MKLFPFISAVLIASTPFVYGENVTPLTTSSTYTIDPANSYIKVDTADGRNTVANFDQLNGSLIVTISNPDNPQIQNACFNVNVISNVTIPQSTGDLSVKSTSVARYFGSGINTVPVSSGRYPVILVGNLQILDKKPVNLTMHIKDFQCDASNVCTIDANSGNAVLNLNDMGLSFPSEESQVKLLAHIQAKLTNTGSCPTVSHK
jgi:hypothetical protein